MSKSAVVFPVTEKYIAEGEALICSLLKHNPDIDVHVITINYEANFFNQYANVVVVHNEPACDSEFRQVRTSRFRYAAELKDQYSTVGILDADMVTIRPIHKLLRMAETGTILVGSNNTLYRYLKKDFDAMQVEADSAINVVHGSFCTVPTFINPRIHYDFLMSIWRNSTGNDLEIPNLLAQSMNLYRDYIFLLPSYISTGIHHSMVKPETFCRETDDGLYSQQGEPIYLLHGHLWDTQEYHKQLLEPMVKNYGYHTPYIDCTKQCIQILYKEYMKYYREPIKKSL